MDKYSPCIVNGKAIMVKDNNGGFVTLECAESIKVIYRASSDREILKIKKLKDKNKALSKKIDELKGEIELIKLGELDDMHRKFSDKFNLL